MNCESLAVLLGKYVRVFSALLRFKELLFAHASFKSLIISFVVISLATPAAIASDICVPDTLSVSSVSGRVISKLNKGETPLNNAVVTLVRGGNDGPVIAQQTVKEDGSFSFKVKPGKYQLRVSARGLSNFYLDLQVKRSKVDKDQKEIIVIMGLDFEKYCFGSYAELRVKNNN